MRRLILTLAIVLTIAPTCAAEELSPAFRALLAASVGAHIADFTTTQSALNRPGTAEGNPLMAWTEDRPWAMGAAKFSVVGASTWVKADLYRRGHERMAWVWVIAETAAISYVAYHNSKQGR